MVEEDGFLNVGFVPDFEQLEREMEDETLEKEVTLTEEGDGLEDFAADTPDGGTANEDGGGGGMGGMMGMAEPLMSMSGNMAKLVGIAGVLLMLEPIQQTLSLMMRLLEISVLPILLLITALLEPFIREFMRLMPALMEFASNPGEAFKAAIAVMMDRLGQLLESLLDIPSASEIGAAIMDRLKTVIDQIPGVNTDDSDDDGGSGLPSSPGEVTDRANQLTTALTTSKSVQEAAEQPQTTVNNTGGGNNQSQNTGDQQTAVDAIAESAGDVSNLFPDLSEEAKKEQTLQLFGTDVGDVYGGGLFG